ncbi:hypothetical protein BGZ63DRAFT_421552 [Mariannaea sp. PMI_226]|nr:hypothetical protein BGZ63DRAFT_421552 [Mariannaea sp. PMI_226]
MPAFVNSSSRAARFELPALDLNFGSLADGTDIPPPPDSPVQKVPTPPQTPPPTKAIQEVAKLSDDESKNSSTNGNLAGTKRNADDVAPLSPAASSRQGSIRRLFSRTTLNNSYAEGQTPNGSLSVANGARPSSQGGTSFVDERKAKRSSGWFRRIRTGDSTPNKRSSMAIESTPLTPTTKKPSGPPPPMIPEFTDLEKDSGILGDDLFKNIK